MAKFPKLLALFSALAILAGAQKSLNFFRAP